MKRLLCLLLALCLLPILAACGGGGDPPENPPEGEVFSEGLAYEKNEDGTCTITGIGTCTDTEIRVPYTIEGCRVTAIAAGAFKVQRSLTASAMATLYPGTGGIIDRLPDDFFDDGQNPAGSDTEEEERVDAPKDEETNARLEAITSVELPIYLDDIGDEAFLGCEELAEISTRQLVSMIGKDCFKETAFYNDPANWENGVLYLAGYLVEVKKDFSGPLVVKEGTFSVAALAAQDCTGITSISFPSTLGSICRRAFCGCTGVEEITFSPNVNFIGLRAFQGCSSLESLTLSCYDLNVQGYAFRDCTSLKSISVGMDLDYYKRPEGVIEIVGGSVDGGYADYKGAAPNADADGRPYVYPTAMQHGIFKGCTSLEAVELKKTVSGMLNGWFTDCTALRSVKLSDNMTTLGNRSFADCPELSELDLGTGLTSIWSQAFYNCPKLTEFVIPDGVTTLEAFYWNCPVEKITFGAGIQKIDWTYPEISVFYYNGTMEQWAKVDISKWKNRVEAGGVTLMMRGAFTVKCLDGDIYDPNGFAQ